jgi:hypothetical protein
MKTIERKIECQACVSAILFRELPDFPIFQINRRRSATNGKVGALKMVQKTVTKRAKTVTNRGQNYHKTGEKLSLRDPKVSQSALNTGI